MSDTVDIVNQFRIKKALNLNGDLYAEAADKIEALHAQIKALTTPSLSAIDAYCQGHGGYTGDYLATVRIEEDAALLAGIAAVERYTKWKTTRDIW